MKLKLVTLSILATFLAHSIPAQAAESFPLTLLEIRGLGYFSRLEYDDPTALAAMPPFEAKLIDSADFALLLPETDAYFPDNALIFIYAALFMDNELDAFKQGKIPFALLTQEKKFSASGNEVEEIKLREAKIIAYVEKAKTLLPNDVRMDSWLIGMKVKHLGSAYADTIIKMAQERQDTFSLISALTVTKDLALTDEQQDILAKLVNRFTSLKSPCLFGKKRSQCRSTSLAPFAAQTGVVMLADYRLKMAEKETSSRKQLMGRIFARMLYRSTHMVWMKSTTPDWVNQSIIPERVQLTQKEHFSVPSLSSYWKTPSARVVYKCTSCHAPSLTPDPKMPPAAGPENELEKPDVREFLNEME